MDIVLEEIIELDDQNLEFKYFMNSSGKNGGYRINVQHHWHDLTEILHVERGNAVQYVNDRKFSIGKGDIVIIRSRDIHATYSDSGTDIRVFQIGDSFLDKKDRILGERYETFTGRIEIGSPIASAVYPGNDILACLDRMEEEYTGKKKGWEFSVISRYCEIIAICIRNFPETGNPKKSSDEAKEGLRKVFDHIALNFSEKIYLDDVRKLTNYSLPHFCRIFKKNTGMSFHEYLNQYRIKASADMLQKDRTVTDIAMECGFSSINSYIRAFKDFTGMPPGHYRKVSDK